MTDNDMFPFPIVMEDKDERNKSFETFSVGDESQIFIGEAELPYFDFIGVIDKWGPSEQSKENARTGKFDHCLVMFQHCGVFLVPWNKKKFKEKIRDFAIKRDAQTTITFKPLKNE